MYYCYKITIIIIIITIVLTRVFDGKKYKKEGSGVRLRQKCVTLLYVSMSSCYSFKFCYKVAWVYANYYFMEFRTIKQDCLATVKLCLSEDCQKLVVSRKFGS